VAGGLGTPIRFRQLPLFLAGFLRDRHVTGQHDQQSWRRIGAEPADLQQRFTPGRVHHLVGLINRATMRIMPTFCAHNPHSPYRELLDGNLAKYQDA
jgi:hypothetical protein